MSLVAVAGVVTVLARSLAGWLAGEATDLPVEEPLAGAPAWLKPTWFKVALALQWDVRKPTFKLKVKVRRPRLGLSESESGGSDSRLLASTGR